MNCFIFSLDGTHGPVILGRLLLKFRTLWDFLGGPVVKNLPFDAGSVGSTPDPGAKIPHASSPRSQNINNRSNTVTNPIETLKKIIKKKFRTLVPSMTQLSYTVECRHFFLFNPTT